MKMGRAADHFTVSVEYANKRQRLPGRYKLHKIQVSMYCKYVTSHGITMNKYGSYMKLRENNPL